LTTRGKHHHLPPPHPRLCSEASPLRARAAEKCGGRVFQHVRPTCQYFCAHVSLPPLRTAIRTHRPRISLLHELVHVLCSRQAQARRLSHVLICAIQVAAIALVTKLLPARSDVAFVSTSKV